MCPIAAAQDSLAERSKAVAQGATPQGRGFEPRSCHSLISPLACDSYSPHDAGHSMSFNTGVELVLGADKSNMAGQHLGT